MPCAQWNRESPASVREVCADGGRALFFVGPDPVGDGTDAGGTCGVSCFAIKGD